MKAKIDMKIKILMMSILVLIALNPVKLLYESNLPNVYQKENVLALEEKS